LGLNPNVKYFLRLGLENINNSKMKQKLTNLFKLAAVTAVMLAPAVAFGYNEVQGGLQTSGLSGLFGTGGLTSSQSLPELIANAIRLMLLFAGAIAVVFVIIGGYQYLTSGGNEESAEKGQKTLTNAVIGVVIVVLAYVIINVIVNLVSGYNGFGG
jgi:hypothetical protein